MVRETKTKTAALVLTAFIILLAATVPCTSVQGTLHHGCSWIDRIVYPFLHASILHAIINCWCLLSLVFSFHISARMLLLAFAIAASAPAALVQGPTVGLSGLCFFLMARCSFLVHRKLLFHAWCGAYLAIGFLFPACAAWLHLYCYTAGLLVGWLNSPAR